MSAMEEAQEPLLLRRGQAEDREATIQQLKKLDVKYTDILQGMMQQSKMAWPLLLNLVASYAISIISLAFVGHLGKQELAAAALGSSFVSILARVIVQGLCGALDTQASQAFGAGNHGALPAIFQRSVLFMWVHALPLTALLLAAPKLLAQKEGDKELAEMSLRYLVYLMPLVWLDGVARPLNRILVAQRITRPQCVVSLLVVPLHVATNWGLIHYMEMGYVGAAVAACLANIYFILLTGLYVWAAGLSSRVWGTLSKQMFTGWREYARIAYPACFMRCAESLGFSLMTLSAGLLPDPETAVAAISVAFNIYGILFMGFSAMGMTAATFVGNGLGSGSALQAKIAALSAVAAGPMLWLVVAMLLMEPHTQAALISIFTDGKDAALLYHLRHMLYIVAMLELLDGTQTIMSGVISGAGKQKYGAVINLVAFYVFAIPVALLLGFWGHLGVEGMYIGMALGPLVQTACYGSIILRMRWAEEALRASVRSSKS